MEKRRLGRTGHESTVVTFGGAGVGRATLTQDQVDEAVELAMSRGVNHLDIAPSYGQAMEKMAPWIPKIRDKIFLGAKTTMRSKEEAWEDIRSCMSRLGVDSFDLFQLHSVGTMEALDAATAPGGALEALVELRDQGLTKWIGITGHGPEVPRVQLEALRRFDFDTIMFPVNAAMYRNAEYRRDAERLLAEANSKDVGVQVIKMIARGGWGDRDRERDTWYDPHREQADIDRALWWVLSQPVHTAPSAGDVKLIGNVLDAADRFRPLNSAEQEEVVTSQRPPMPEPNLAILPAS
jgi:aryl-alcohol dehydrogenase-like predicted oxidoreductase